MTEEKALARHQRLVRALMDSQLHDHSATHVDLIETHISSVLLTGAFAYKLKKPVNLGFLDFSTLEQRRQFCREELRLNRRLAPQLYVEVVPITGTVDRPTIGGSGEAIDYAVKMRQFPQDAQLDRLLERSTLAPAQLDTLARELADFHRRAAVADSSSAYGTPEGVAGPIRANFETLCRSLIGEDERNKVAWLRGWSEEDLARHRSVLLDRKASDAIRECHGDLHAGNMVVLDGRVVVFDCLEFNPALRWIDVMSDLAFLVMDLEDRSHPALSRRLLNGYLEISGDYAGVPVLRTYQVYRALVRAKVACLRIAQLSAEHPDRVRRERELRDYLGLADRYSRPSRPTMIIMHGFSGSGKSVLSQQLLEALGMVRLRSDAERKRLFGLAIDARSGSGLESGLYTTEADQRTYGRLAEQARLLLRAGYSVIIDATTLQRWQRDELLLAGGALNVPTVVLETMAPVAALRQRVCDREEEQQDASEAGLVVLNHQLTAHEPLAADERRRTVTVDTSEPYELGSVIDRLGCAAAVRFGC